MTTMTGADVARLRALAQRMRAAGEQLGRLRGEIGGGLERSPWQGGDATSFRSAWNERHSAALQTAVAGLSDAAKTLDRNADEQDAASGSGGAVAGSALAFGTPMRPDDGTEGGSGPLTGAVAGSALAFGTPMKPDDGTDGGSGEPTDIAETVTEPRFSDGGGGGGKTTITTPAGATVISDDGKTIGHEVEKELSKKASGAEVAVTAKVAGEISHSDTSSSYKVEESITAKAGGDVPLGGGVTAGGSAHRTQTSSFEVKVPAGAEARPYSLSDPAALPTGAEITVRAEDVHGAEGHLGYKIFTAGVQGGESGTFDTSTITKFSDHEVRITRGDGELGRDAGASLSLGGLHASFGSAGHRESGAGETALLDLNDPGGRAAYAEYIAHGTFPADHVDGVSQQAKLETYDYGEGTKWSVGAKEGDWGIAHESIDPTMHGNATWATYPDGAHDTYMTAQYASGPTLELKAHYLPDNTPTNEGSARITFHPVPNEVSSIAHMTGLPADTPSDSTFVLDLSHDDIQALRQRVAGSDAMSAGPYAGIKAAATGGAPDMVFLDQFLKSGGGVSSATMARLLDPTGSSGGYTPVGHLDVVGPTG